MANGTKGEGGSPPDVPRAFPWITVFIVALLIGAVTFLALRRKQPQGSESKKGGRGGAAGPIVAVLGQVQQKDFPLYLDGLGTVQAFNTVTVRSRVEGQLNKLSFKEGQDVRKGDLLA